jgi:3-methyl-2-oxobutanoate hydroxymethyltransferase
MREAGEKITMLTAYDATFAAVADAAGVECILVGDSLGMVCQGLHSTVGVTLDTMAYHTASVARGLHRVQGTAWLIADLPYGSYAESREQAAQRLRADAAGAHMVKLEGGGWTAPTVRFSSSAACPSAPTWA